MALNEKMKEIRETAEKTTAEAASLIGVTTATYTKYESGASMPKIENIIKFADVFDVSLDYLFERDDFIHRLVYREIDKLNENASQDETVEESESQESVEEIDMCDVTESVVTSDDSIESSTESNDFYDDLEDDDELDENEELDNVTISGDRIMLLETLCEILPDEMVKLYKNVNFDKLKCMYKDSTITALDEGFHVLSIDDTHYFTIPYYSHGIFVNAIKIEEQFDLDPDNHYINSFSVLYRDLPDDFKKNYKIKKKCWLFRN